MALLASTGLTLLLAGLLVWRRSMARANAERTRLTAALASAHARLDLLAEHSGAAAFVLDRNGILRSISAPLLGHDPDRLAGRSLHELIHPADHAAALARRRALDRDGAVHARVRLRDASGGYRRASLGLRRLAAGGALAGVIGDDCGCCTPADVAGDPTAAPRDATAAPGDLTAAPGDLTAAPRDATAAPGNLTAAPGNLTAAPGELTAAPRDPTAAPRDPTALPDDALQAANRPADPPNRDTDAVEDLRRGIAAGELELVYQPQVDMRSGRLVAVEALVRWRHPRRGLLAPDAFVGVAERSGQSDALTRAVLDIALGAQAVWREAGIATTLAVNVATRSLHSPELATWLAERLSAADVPPGGLRLELRAEALVDDATTAARALRLLERLGIEASLDDFDGDCARLRPFAGSSLREVKLAARGGTGARLAIERAHSLGVRVVAEGVEDAAAWARLRALACDAAQGYHIAKPMPAAGLAGWLAGWDAERSLGIERAAVARARGEEALRDTQRALGEILTTDTAGVALQALDGRFMRVNPALCRMLGVSEARLLELSFRDVTHPDDQALDAAMIRELIDGRDRARYFDKRYLRSDGSCLWAQTTRVVVRADDGRPLHFVTRVVDVSERKRHELELRRLTRFQDAIVRATGQGIVGLSGAGAIIFANPAATHMTGWSAGDIVGRSLDTTLRGGRADGAPIARLLAAGRVERAQRDTFARVDGGEVAVSWMLRPVLDDGRAIGGVLVFQPSAAAVPAAAA